MSGKITCPVCERQVDELEACADCYNKHFANTMRLEDNKGHWIHLSARITALEGNLRTTDSSRDMCSRAFVQAKECNDGLKKKLAELKQGIREIIDNQYSKSWHEALEQMVDDLTALIGEDE